MSSNILNLATCGESVKIWKLPQKEELHQTSNSDKIKNLTWSYDGSSLASFGSKKSDHFTLSILINDTCSSTEILGPLGANHRIRAILYPNTTKKILSVAVEDKVVLFDVEKKKSKLQFSNIKNVSSMAMNSRYVQYEGSYLCILYSA